MKTTNEEQKKGNRYFCCSSPSVIEHNQFLVVTASQSKQIEANSQHQSSSDPVRSWAYHTLVQAFGSDGQNLPGFRELPQEEGDRLQVMSDVLSGRVTVEDLNDTKDQTAEDAS